jgi:glycosyltransferase involved in cell wall biosynthesis
MTRVAVDTSGCFVIQAGVARYIRGLLRGFRELQAPALELLELAWKVENFGYAQPRRLIRTVYRDVFWAKWAAPRLLRRSEVDLLHSTVGYYVRPPRGLKNIVTVHDLAFVRHPERFRKWQGWIGRANLRGIASAERLICISRFTADETMELLKIPATKIDVVYNGADFQADENTPEEKPTFDVPGEFFLFVGSLEPGKNLALLRSVYRQAEESGRRLPPLMIVGARWQGVPGEGAPPRDWHYLGRQPDAVLVYLYRRALALAFPSKYEGFGLPVVEAMALGCPVVCGPVASLPEVGGEAVLLAELTVETFGKALRQVSEDGELREEMRQRGAKQAAQFTWRKCAAGTLESYMRVKG